MVMLPKMLVARKFLDEWNWSCGDIRGGGGGRTPQGSFPILSDLTGRIFHLVERLFLVSPTAITRTFYVYLFFVACYVAVI